MTKETESSYSSASGSRVHVTTGTLSWSLSLFRKIPSIGAVILIMFAALIVAFGLVFLKIWTAEKDAAQRETASVSRVFENHKQSILDEMERYAASNAAYLNIDTNFWLPWIEDRFSEDMATDFAYSAAYLIDPDNNVVYRNEVEIELGQKPIIPELAGFGGVIDEIRENYLEEIRKMDPDNISFSGLFPKLSGIEVIELQDQIALAAAFAIVPDPGGIPIADRNPYVIVTVHILDSEHLAGILRSLSLSNLVLSKDIPSGMNGIGIAGKSQPEIGYLAWYPMSQGSAILLSSAPVLLIAISVILFISLLSIRQNSRSKRRLTAREQEARYAANHDNLTGFALRQHFSDLAEIPITHQNQGYSAIVYLDIDRLKLVNDTFGHAAGDKLIKSCASRIEQSFHSSCVIGRVGGDEFLIFVYGRDKLSEIHSLVRDATASLNHPIEFEGNSIQVSCSAGLAFYPDHGKDLKELTRAADIALQRSKESGRNALRVFDTEMDHALRESREIHESLLTALHDEEFELYYQPIVEANSNSIVFAEALLRWHHPMKEMIPPDVFIPIAQNAGLMSDIGSWVLETAIADASAWPGQGVSVNICTSQLMQSSFVKDVLNLLDRYRLPAKSLILEITETQILDQIDETNAVLNELRSHGVQCALDDFGTGYSSLSYLNLYNFDKLKIDKSFLARKELDKDARKLLSTMINLGKVMGMQVVIEGVETEQQRKFLKTAGSDFFQGYLFARPMPLEDLKANHLFEKAAS
ncbi:MAG: bifunctional diguanylate cyclase/phosphodiesterase [Roseibium sp.]